MGEKIKTNIAVLLSLTLFIITPHAEQVLLLPGCWRILLLPGQVAEDNNSAESVYINHVAIWECSPHNNLGQVLHYSFI